MYRLTFDGVQAMETRAKRMARTQATVGKSQPPKTQRVYRWENCWGYCIPGAPTENNWFAERRISESYGIATDGTKFLLERIEPLLIDAPPLKVDDIWEEEVILLGHGGMVTKSVSISGSIPELTEFLVRNGISLPPELTLLTP